MDRGACWGDSDTTVADSRGLRIVFMGTAEFAVPSLQALVSARHRLVGVVTPPDRPAGRGRELRASPVKLAAMELGLPVIQPERASRGEGIEQLRALSPELLLVAAFGEILTPEALAVPSRGAVNLHASLLPRYRGPAPIQRAIMAGERVTGVTVQWMASELDAGDIILQQQVEIGEEEDFGSLHARLALLGAELGLAAVALIQRGEAPRRPQDPSRVSYAPPIISRDLVIDWARPAEELALLVRALSPRPGARTTRDGGILKVLQAGSAKNPVCAGGVSGSEAKAAGVAEAAPPPGQVVEIGSGGLAAATGDGWLRVLRLQPAGRRAMSAADYVKGYRLRLGDRLGG